MEEMEPPTSSLRRKRMRGSIAEKEQPPSPPLFSASLPDDPAFKQKQDRIVQKAKRLAFPQDGGSVYRLISARKQYGRDNPLGGAAHLVGYHKSRLNCLLDDLLLKHQWREAAGLLSVLLRTLPTEERWKSQNSHQFWAAMEVTRQLETLQGNDSKFRKMYQILYDKQPQDRKTRDKTKAGAVRLELALYLMGQKNYDDALLASRPLMDMPPYRDHAVANMIHGLILHHQWYDLITQEVVQGSDGRADAHFKSGKMDFLEGIGENEELISDNDTHSTFLSKQSLLSKLDGDTSETSVPISDFSEEYVMRRSSRKTLKQNVLPDDGKITLQSFYDDIEEERDMSYIKNARVLCFPGMDRKLFPVSFPNIHQGRNYAVPMVTTKVKGAHTNAIKHLRKALALDGHLTMALLPLVQLMLAGADVEGAYEEIEKCCQGSDHCVPFRIKGMFLESLTPRNSDMLSRCYEDTLERDPASVQSINGLINLHDHGEYSTEALLDFIAHHLDGSFGSTPVWRKLLASFKQLKEIQEQYNENDDVLCKPHFNECVQKAWTYRGSWWRLKHFKSASISEELKPAGGHMRVVYKAACAAHIYGPSMPYVTEVEEYLKAQGGHRSLAKLQKHKENCFNLLACLKNCDNHRNTE